MKPLVSKKYFLPFALITTLFFLWGAAHSILDVLNKHFQLEMGINHAHSSLVQVMFYLGYFVMAIPAGIYIDRRGYRRGVVAGLLLFGLGALMFWPGAQMMSFSFFLFSLFIIACGLVFLETAANPYAAQLGDRETAASRLNLAQALNGLGCICGPLFGGLLLFSDGGSSRIALPYVVMGIVVLAAAVLFCFVKLPEISDDSSKSVKPETAKSSEGNASSRRQKGESTNTIEETKAPQSAAPSALPARHALRTLFHNRLFLFGLFALFSYEVSEISINSFFINYVVDNQWMNARDASIVLATGGLLLFMLGRVAGSIIMRHVSSYKVLRFCSIGTFVTTFIVVLSIEHISLAALILVYIFESIMFPTIFAHSLQGLGSLTKRASSLLMMTPVGGAIGPLLMGLVSDAANISVAFIIPLIGFANVAAYAFSPNFSKKVA